MSALPMKKMASSAASGSAEDSPLSQFEISCMTGLLHRAIKFRQTSQVISAFRESHAPKSSLAIHSAVLQECDRMVQEEHGSMTDASKRQREVEGDDAFDAWNVYHYGDNYPHTGFPGNQPAATYAGSAGYAVPMPEEPSRGKINQKIPLPVSLTEESWGKSICKMDKVKEWSKDGLSYIALVERAKYSRETQNYLVWIKKTFGTGGTGNVDKKVTRAVDLALYLERMNWETDAQEPFVREFAD